MFPLAGIGLKLLGFGGAVKSAAAKIPPKVWYALAVVAALVLSVIVHQHYSHKALRAADVAGYNRRATEDAKALAALRTRVQTAEANATRLSQEVRIKHDQEVDANAAAAHALFVRGPGAASCRSVGNPGISTGSGSNGGSHRETDATVAKVPSGEGIDLFGLPVDGAVAFGQQNDDLLAEVRAWHAWYPLMVSEWNKLRKKP